MAITGKMLKGAIHISSRMRKRNVDFYISQTKTLQGLLKKASSTAFGKAYDFQGILRSENVADAFQRTVPYHDYNSMYEQWWSQTLEGKADIAWPGRVRHFALSSGTTGAASKKIPITTNMLMSMRKVGFWHYCRLKELNLPSSFYEKQILMLGGSTQLRIFDGQSEGDLSGILAGNLPSWINPLYRPGKAISEERDWEVKLQKIAEAAPQWDIGIIAGVPAWVQLMIEKVLEVNGLENIHQIWPNLKLYVHGGVSFTPYKNNFEKLFGVEMVYLETYLASEGFFAFEERSGSGSMTLILKNGIYYEFVAVNDQNFDQEGQLKPGAVAMPLSGVREGVEYALLITTCAGAWRYVIGDTIRFTHLQSLQIKITGRLKQFLSLCGEHLSVDNMNQAICMVADQLSLDIREFTVYGIPEDNLFAHKWYIGVDKEVSKDLLTYLLDEALKVLNDDYATERTAAIKEVYVETLPNALFYKWMKEQGKVGGQGKFPRVMNKAQQANWEAFLLRNKA